MLRNFCLKSPLADCAITKVIKEGLKTKVVANKWTSGQLTAAKVTFWENIIDTGIGDL